MEIRKLTVADSSNLLNLALKLDNETKFMMLEPDERSTTLEDMQRWLAVDDSKSAYIGAYDGESLVGYVNSTRGDANRIRHSAYIVMGILASHAGQGIGKLLLSKIDEWAISHGITRLELTVMVHNTNAIGLYEKMGFNKEGTKKNSMMVDGNFVDEYYMSKILYK